MRTWIAVLSLSLIASASAFAQVREPSGASATAQPQLPSAVSSPASATPEKAPTTSMPLEAAPPLADQSEPNLKHGAASLSKISTYLIQDAPLPDDYVMGKSSAPIVIVEYASMSCPHCAHFSNTVLPQLQKDFIDTGKVRYILRQFPLNEPALKAAMLLDCVGEQNKSKYFLFAKVLFESQNKWAFDNNYLSNLETIATVGGLSKEQFDHCVNNTDREMKILKTKKLAADEVKVPHTPYIFIAGEPYEGDRTPEAISDSDDKLPTLETLQRRIDEAKHQAGIDAGKEGTAGDQGKGMGQAMAYATELMAGILVGGFAGYWLDRWLGTSPVFLIVLFFLGAAAGFRNILRNAGKNDE